MFKSQLPTPNAQSDCTRLNAQDLQDLITGTLSKRDAETRILLVGSPEGLPHIPHTEATLTACLTHSPMWGSPLGLPTGVVLIISERSGQAKSPWALGVGGWPR